MKTNIREMKRSVPSIYISIPSNARDHDINNYSPNIKEYIWKSVYEGIEYSIKHKRKNAKILDINNSGYCLAIPKSEWDTLLAKKEAEYNELEDYEEAGRIRDLRNKIK